MANPRHSRGVAVELIELGCPLSRCLPFFALPLLCLYSLCRPRSPCAPTPTPLHHLSLSLLSLSLLALSPQVPLCAHAYAIAPSLTLPALSLSTRVVAPGPPVRPRLRHHPPGSPQAGAARRTLRRRAGRATGRFWEERVRAEDAL